MYSINLEQMIMMHQEKQIEENRMMLSLKDIGIKD